jgi:hypothetical protein
VEPQRDAPSTCHKIPKPNRGEGDECIIDGIHESPALNYDEGSGRNYKEDDEPWNEVEEYFQD